MTSNRALNKSAPHLWIGALLFGKKGSSQRAIVDRPEGLNADFVLSRAELHYG
jgi:hypothetical protein